MSEPQTQVTVEGATVADAVRAAAEQLGVPASLVQHKLDLSHFRNAAGRAVAVDTVRIFAWTRDPETVAGASAAAEWLQKLVGLMGLQGEVRFDAPTGGNKSVELRVLSPDARFLVGRQGTTLRAIQMLLDAAMASAQPGWAFRIEIDGGDREAPRPMRDDRDGDRRGPRRDRDDGPPRDFRGRDRDGGPDGPRRDGPRDDRDGPPRRDRDDRGPRGRGRDDRGPGGPGARRSEEDLDKLRKLTARLAEEVLRTGEPTEIRRELNSFERRVVHMVVQDFEGVASESVGDGPTKVVRLMPAGNANNPSGGSASQSDVGGEGGEG